MESMMTARQVAELLGVHENWVYDQAVGGNLPSYKIGGARRFDAGELRRWISEHRDKEREREAPPRAARGTSVPAAARSRPPSRERRTLERESPKRANHRKRRQPVDDSGGEQPTLFEI
jgi:excisionase family DNA binding protein